MVPELELADWRRCVSELYANVRAEPDPRRAHELWRARRDDLFLGHPQSPLPADHPLRRSGVPYWPYDPDLRFELPLEDCQASRHVIETGPAETTVIRAIGAVAVPSPPAATLTVWWLDQYGGGLFLPVRDAERGLDDVRRGALPVRQRQGGRPRDHSREPGDRLQLPLPPVVSLLERVAVPARAGGESDRGSAVRRRASLSESMKERRLVHRKGHFLGLGMIGTPMARRFSESARTRR